MPDGPWLLSEEEQEEENRAQRAAFAEAQQAALEGRPPRKITRNPNAQGEIQDRVTDQQNARRNSPFATGNSMMNHGASGAYHAAMGSAQQGKALGDMISQTMGAHQDENDSRVAQLREMRRMEHEKELKRMELDAILARLSQAQQPTGPQPKAAFRGGAIY
jgi:hypothetical protein